MGLDDAGLGDCFGWFWMEVEGFTTLAARVLDELECNLDAVGWVELRKSQIRYSSLIFLGCPQVHSSPYKACIQPSSMHRTP
jgi:hypothetical protein